MKTLTLTATLILALSAAMLRAQTGEALYSKALSAERGDGNYREALRLYQQVEKEHARDEALVVRALLRIADVYLKLGERERALATYRRILNDFGTHAEGVSEARTRVAELSPAPQPTGDAATAPEFAPRLLWTPHEELHPRAISHDGRWLGIHRLPGAETLVQNLATGEFRPISPSTDPPVLSRDGSLVAYNFWGEDDLSPAESATPGGKNFGGLRVTENRPSGATRVVKHNPPGVAYFIPFAFAPDNRYLFVLVVHEGWTRQIARVSLDDGGMVVLKSLGWRRNGGPRVDEPVLSPDGRYIAYAALRGSPSADDVRSAESTDRHIYLLAVDGSSESTVVAGEAVNSNPMWSPDGSRLFFVSNRGGDGTHLWAVGVRNGNPAPGAAPVRVQRLTGTLPLGMTTTGAMYYMRETDPRDGVQVGRYDPSNGTISDVRALNENIAYATINPSWSPDGRLIAFRRAVEGDQYQTAVRSTETGADVAYPQGLGASPIRGPVRWFHKGRRLLEWCMPQSCAGRSPGIYRVDLDTREIALQLPRRLADGTVLTPLNAIAPDDRTLYSVLRTADDTGRGARIGAVDMETGRMLSSFEAPGLSTINGLALSPDGRTLAVTGTPIAPVTEGEVRQRFEQQLAGIDVDGGNYRVLHSGFLMQQVAWAQTLTWTRDGRHILFGQSGPIGSTAFGENHVMRIPAQGGSPEPTGLKLAGAGGPLSFDADGRRIVFNGREWFAPELWVLEPVAKR